MGGTLDIVVTKVVTKAYTEDHVVINATGSESDITVRADDKYDLIAVVGTVAASGTAGVGVSVLTTVSYNTVSAVIGNNNTINAGRDITVSAASDRLVQGYVLTVGGGSVGVSGSIMVVVAGSLLTEDAHNGIYVSNDEASAMDPQKQTDGAFSQAHSAAQGYKPQESLTVLLASDGSSAKGTAEGNGTIDYNNYGQDTSGKDNKEGSDANMNDATYDSAADGIVKTGTQGATINGTELSDATTAVVKGGDVGTSLTAGRNVSVHADDNLSAYMAGGSIAVGAYAGVGAGVSVAVLYSNVQAVVEDNVTISAGGNVSVTAVSGADEVKKAELEFNFGRKTNQDPDSTSTINNKVAESDPGNTAATGDKSTILLIGVTGSGGIAGVSVTVASLNLMNKTYARMMGDITKAQNITVQAETQYGTVLAITLAAAAGIAGVSGSVAVTYFESRTEASIGGNANISNVTGTIYVKINGTTNASSASTAVGAGAAGVAVPISVAVNRSRFDAFIGQGVTINAPNNAPNAAIDMDGALKADARAIIVSMGAGVAGIGVSAAVAVNRPVMLTYIGVTPDKEVIESSSASAPGTITVKSVTIDNKLDGSTDVSGLGLAIGGVAVNGTVALGFNRAKSYAAINKTNVIVTGDIDITSAMDGDTNVYATSVVGGSVAVGATVAVAQIKSENVAMVETEGTTVRAANITIHAGTDTDPYDTEAITTVITGSAGSIAVALNFAVAINGSVNRAKVGGTGGILTANNTLDISANGRTKAYAVVINAAGGGIAANVSMAYATLSSVQEALLSGNAKVTTGNLTVKSTQNQVDTKGSPFGVLLEYKNKGVLTGETKTITPNSMAQAFIFSASAGIACVTANTATALSNATSRAKASAADLTITGNGNITIQNTADSVATITVDNLKAGWLSVGVMVGYARAAGTFEALLESTGKIDAKNISITNTWKGKADAVLTPALGGINASYYGGEANLAFADVMTQANTGIKGSGAIGSTDKRAGSITVGAIGTAYAHAEVVAPVLSASAKSVATNTVNAYISAVQETFINGVDLYGASVSLTSELNKGETEGAKAQLGGNAADNTSFELTGKGAELNTAIAEMKATNRSYMKDAGIDLTGNLTVQTDSTSYAEASLVDKVGEVSGISIGINVLKALANGTFEAYIDTARAITAGKITVDNHYQARAEAETRQPGLGIGNISIEAVSVKNNTALASVGVKAYSYIKGSGTVTATGGVDVTVTGTAQSVARLADAEASVDGIKIVANVVTSELKAEQKAYIEGVNLIATGKDVKVFSSFNKKDGSNIPDGAVADVGGAGLVNASLVNGEVHTVSATSNATVQAYMYNVSVDAGDVSVLVDATSNAYAGKANPYVELANLGLGVLVMNADASGSFGSWWTTKAGSKSNVQNVYVKTTYYSKAYAVSTQPEYGVSASYESAEVNLAHAKATTGASASIRGMGSIEASGNVEVSADGDADVDAKIETADISLSKINIAVSEAKAELKVNQSAYISGPGKDYDSYTGIDADGYVKVLSTLTADGYAATGGNKSTVNVSAVSGKTNLVDVSSTTINKAYIENAVVKADGDVDVKASTTSTVTGESTQESVDVELVSLGFVDVTTDSNNQVEAYIAGGKGSRVTGKSVDILATGTTTVRAKGSVPTVSITLASGNSVELTASAGKGTNGKITKAYIGSGSEVYSVGEGDTDDINVKAESLIDIEAKVNTSTKVSGANLGLYKVATYTGKTDTQAYINGTAESYNDINVAATDLIKAVTDIGLLNAGIVNGGSSTVTNTVNSQNVSVGFGNNSKVKAWRNVSARAKSKLDLYSRVQDSGYGLGTNCSATAANTVTRNVSATVGNGAAITAVVGNIEILSEGDEDSSIESIAKGSSGAAYAGGGPSANITYTSNVTTTVGGGSDIEAKYGTLDIRSKEAMTMYAYAYRKASAAVASNKSTAKITATTNVSTKIAENATEKARLLGEYTTIGAYIVLQKIHANAISYTASAGSKTEAVATSNVNNTLNTKIDNAYVGGIETLTVAASVDNQNIKSESYAEVVGFTGKVYATSEISGSNTVNITVTGKSELAGKDILLDSSAPELTSSVIDRSATAIANTVVNYVWTKVKTVVEKVVKVLCKIPLLGKLIKKIVKKVVEWVDKLVEVILYSDAEANQTGTFNNAGNIVFNGTAHVGGGAAGTYIDIFDKDSIKYSGLDSELTTEDRTTEKFLTVNEDGNTVTINKLYNDDGGSMKMTAAVGNISGKGTIISNSYLPNVNITNHTDLDLVVMNAVLKNESAIAPDISTDAEGNDSFTYTVDEDRPALTVTSLGIGDVTFADGKETDEMNGRVETDLGEGVLTIHMNGGNLYTTGASFVAANKLYIDGAGQIGQNMNNPFRAYVFDISSYDGTTAIKAQNARPNEVKVQADGAIYLKLTLVREWMTKTQMNSASGIQAELNLAEVIGGRGSTVVIDVAAPKVVCANMPETDDDYYISIPRGEMNYVTLPAEGNTFKEVQIKDADGKETDFWITKDGMLVNKQDAITFVSDAYKVQQTDKYDTYLLPNGATVVVDKVTNKLVRVINRISDDATDDYSGGIFDFSNLSVTTDTDGNPVITITGSGAEFDQKITMKDGIAYMEIGVNGATTYIESSGMENGTGWLLPNGIIVFYKQVFLDERTNTVVTGNFIKTETDSSGKTHTWILLEDIDEQGRTSYHVVKVTTEGEDNHYIFEEGYLYNKGTITAVTEKDLQTLSEAVTEATNKLNAEMGMLQNSYVEQILSQVTDTAATGETYANAIRDAIYAVIRPIITENIDVAVTVTLGATTEYKDFFGNVSYKTSWSFRVILTEDDTSSAISREGTIEKDDNTSLNITAAAVSNNEGYSTEILPKTVETTVYKYSGNDNVYFKGDGRIVYVNVTNSSSGKSRIYKYSLTLGANGWYYLTATANGQIGQILTTLRNVFFLFEGDSLIPTAAIKLSGTGAVSGENLNGGYVKTTDSQGEAKYYRFLDQTTDTKGILLITDRVLALFPNGEYSFIATQQNSDNTGSMMDETIGISPNMQQKLDENGDPVYTEMYMSLYWKNKSDTPQLSKEEINTYFSGFAQFNKLNELFNSNKGKISSREKDFMEALAAFIEADSNLKQNIQIAAYYFVDSEGNKHYDYLTDSDKVYEIYHAVTNGNGVQKYQISGYDIKNGLIFYNSLGNLIRQPVEVTNGYVYLTSGMLEKLSEACYSDLTTKTRIHGISFIPVIEYLEDTVIIVPIKDTEANDAYLYFKDAVDPFAASRDTNGYAIIDRYTRVVDNYKVDGTTTVAEKLGLSVGTILYLDANGNIVAYLTPDGTFRAYEYGETGVQDAYSEYQVDASGKLTTTISAGTPTYFIELAQDVFTSVYGLHEDTTENPMPSYSLYNYDTAHYFGYSEGNKLVELTKVDEQYGYEEKEDGVHLKKVTTTRLSRASRAAGTTLESGFGLSNGSSMLLSIINNTTAGTELKNRAFFIMPDASYVDSKEALSVLVADTLRIYSELEGDTRINLGTVEGGDTFIQTTSPKNGTVYVTGTMDGKIKSDQLVLANKGDSTTLYGDSDNPMKAESLGKDSVTKVLFCQEIVENADGTFSYVGDFTGKAYVDFTGNVLFKDSVIGGDALEQAVVEFSVTGGNAEFKNMEFKENSTFTLEITDEGNVIFDKIQVTGGDNSEETGKEAVLDVSTEDGTITTGNVTLSGQSKVQLTNKNGNITMQDVELQDTSVLETNTTDGNVIIHSADIQSTENGHATLSITTKDTEATDGRTGDLTIQKTMNAQGKVVLDLSGSLLAVLQPEGSEETTSTLILGKDVYKNGSEFKFGGDVGSKELPLVVDVTDSKVPFKVVTVEDMFIRGAQHYDLTEDFDKDPNLEDGEKTIIIDLTPEEIAETITKALNEYEAVMNSEDSTEEEKQEAETAFAAVIKKLVSLFGTQDTDSFRELLEESLTDAALDAYDAFVERLYQKEIIEEVLKPVDPDESDVSVDINDEEAFEEQKAEALEKLTSKKEEEAETLTEEELKRLDLQIAILTGGILEEVLTKAAEDEELKDDVLFQAKKLTEEYQAQILKDMLTQEERTMVLKKVILTAMSDEDEISKATCIELFNGCMTDEQKQAILDQMKAEADKNTPDYTPEDPIDLTVEIGTSTGTKDGINISNYGDITVTQTSGDLHVGVIETNRSDLTPGEKALGNVDISAAGGSIIGLVQADGAANITANEITLSAKDSIIGLVVDEIAKDYEITNEILTKADGEKASAPQLKVETDGRITYTAYVDYTGQYVFDTQADTLVSAEALNGNIEITEKSGNLGLGVISAQKGTVNLTAGAVTDEEGNTGYGAVLDKRTEGQTVPNITAGATGGTSSILGGTIGTNEAPIIVNISHKLIVDAIGDVDLDAKNSLDAQIDTQNGKLTVSAEKNLSVSNTDKSHGGTGDMYVDSLTAGNGDLTVAVDGNFVEVSEGDEGHKAVLKGKNIRVTAGGTVGTDENPLEVDAADGGYLSVIAESAVIEELTGNVTLENVKTDGDFTLKVPGDILDAKDDLLEQEADAKDALNQAKDVLDEINTDLRVQEELVIPPLEKAKEEAEAKETAAKDALDAAKAAKNAADQALKDAQDAVDTAVLAEEAAQQAQQKAKDLAEQAAKELQDRLTQDPVDAEAVAAAEQKLKGAEEALAKAEEALSDAESKLSDAEKALKDAQKVLAEAKEALEDAQATYDQAYEIAEEARKELQDAIARRDELKAQADKAQKDVDAAQKAYDDAAADVDNAKDREEIPTIQTGGSLDLTAGGDVGKSNHGLSLAVDGTVTVDAGGDVHLRSTDDLTIDSIQSNDGNGTVMIRGTGGIRDLEGSTKPAIQAQKLDISTRGDVGEKENPLSLKIQELKADGENIYIENEEDLIIDSIHADEEIKLDVGGDIKMKDQNSIISGERLEATIDGNFGEKDAPVRTNLDKILLHAENIFIHNISDRLDIEGMYGKDIDLTAKGDVSGKDIVADNLTILANGNAGYRDNPLYIYVTGNVNINSLYGGVYYVNGYRLPSDTNEAGKETVSLGTEGKGRRGCAKTGDASQTIMYVYLMLLSLVAILSLRKRRWRMR